MATTRQSAPASSRVAQPLDTLAWVHPDQLHSNSYNPNHVPPVELDLLERSICEDGWTQPIVVTGDGEIVDGFHRWHLAATRPSVTAGTGGLVPVVALPDKGDEARMAATVRHNRARGRHGVMPMGEIVRTLQQSLSDEAICDALGMEPEELERLSDQAGMTKRGAGEEWSRGWRPGQRST